MDVLIILENMYGFNGRLKFPVYPTSLKAINRKNATYSRIIPYFENSGFRLFFTETTPEVVTNNKIKLPADLDYIKSAVELKDWFAVIPCCKKATDSLDLLGISYFCSLPHPASFKWRKQIIIDTINKLNMKKELDGL